MRPEDTSPEAWEIMLDLQRRMDPGVKLRQILDYSWMLFLMAQSTLRADHPEISEREAFLRVASRRLDAATMIAAYGWDPATGQDVPQSDRHSR